MATNKNNVVEQGPEYRVKDKEAKRGYETEYPVIALDEILLSYMRQYYVNAEAAKYLKITGLNPKDKKFMDKIMFDSEFAIQLAKGIESMFNYGSFVVGLTRLVKLANGSLASESLPPLITAGESIYWTKIGGEHQEVWAKGSDIHEVNGEPLVEVLKWYYVRGVPTLEIGTIGHFTPLAANDPNFQINRDKFIPSKIYKFEGENLPVEVIPNNYKYMGEIEYLAIDGLIQEIGRESNWIPKEFNLVKNNVLLSRLTQGSKSSNDWEVKFHNYNVHVIDSADGLLANSALPLATNIQALQQVDFNINFLIDKLEKYSFFLRDTTQSGTNKFNAEIMMFNQVALEYLLMKKHLRGEAWTRVMRKIVGEYVALGFMSSNPEEVKVEIAISEIEQVKLDTLQAQAENLRTIKQSVNVDDDKKEGSNGGKPKTE